MRTRHRRRVAPAGRPRRSPGAAAGRRADSSPSRAGMAATVVDAVRSTDDTLDLAPVFALPDGRSRDEPTSTLGLGHAHRRRGGPRGSGDGGGGRRGGARRGSTPSNPALNAFTDVTAERALREAARGRRGAWRPARPLGAARRRALRGEEPLRRRRPADPRRARRSTAIAPPAARDAVLVERMRGGRRRARSAPSTWANTPTTSPARTPMTAPAATRTIRSADEPAAPPRAAARRRRRGWRRSRSAPTPTARSACRPRSAASSA